MVTYNQGKIVYPTGASGRTYNQGKIVYPTGASGREIIEDHCNGKISTESTPSTTDAAEVATTTSEVNFGISRD
jgi:hypothetical protein